MLISLAVAFVFTPWLYFKVLRRHEHAGEQHDAAGDGLYRLFRRMVGPFLNGDQGRRHRRTLALAVLGLIVASVSLAAVQLVVLKMLPFDNKSEFQVVVDMPEGTTVEQTARVLSELGRYLATVP